MDKTEIKIDYFSATFPLACDEEDDIQLRVYELVKLIGIYFNVKGFEIKKNPRSHNNFKYEFTLGPHIYLRCDGPLNNKYQRTCQLEMKGEGCRNFERHNGKENWYLFLLTMSAQFDAQRTHIDITIDDYDGNIVSFDWLKDKLEREMEAIISEEIWNKTRIKRQERGILQESRIGYVRTHLLSGLMRCPKCGGPMYAQKTLIPTSMENTLNTLTISV